MNSIFKKALLASLISTSALLTACGGSSGTADTNQDQDQTKVGLPAGLTLSFVDANSPKYYSFNTTSEALVDLNDLAATSGDSAVQKLAISDTSTIGSFFHWPDFRMNGDVEALDNKYLLMKPTYQTGVSISSDDFVQLVHFHDTDLAAHSADEFANPVEGSAKAAGLARLNSHVDFQKDLEEEVSEALPQDQILCKAYVDPYQKFEIEQAETSTTTTEAHDHGDLVHFALTQSGRVYFYKEGTSGLESLQGFVTLDGVSNISNCARTTIARTSEDGVLVFVPDTQKLYLVDSHGGDYHQHSTWSVSSFLPSGFHADMMAAIGEGAAHDHAAE